MQDPPVKFNGLVWEVELFLDNRGLFVKIKEMAF
jgi:hypothetical protein